MKIDFACAIDLNNIMKCTYYNEDEAGAWRYVYQDDLIVLTVSAVNGKDIRAAMRRLNSTNQVVYQFTSDDNNTAEDTRVFALEHSQSQALSQIQVFKAWAKQTRIIKP